MRLSDLIFDRRCSICDKQIQIGAVCEKCDAEILSYVKPSCRRLYVGGKTVEARYIFEYDIPVVKRLVFSLKHRANKDLFIYASKLYEMAVGDKFCGTVTNCPRRGRGIRNYGYDQVSEPCRIVCKNSDGRLRFERLLKRKLFSKEQKTLDYRGRIENTRGKFKVIKKDIPKNILIVDDVVTSSSTATACAQAILERCASANITFAFLVSRNGFAGKGQFE